MNASHASWKQGLPHRLSLSFLPAFLVNPIGAQNAYIMRTKCAQKRECDIFNYSATITYNFNTLKCTHFPAPRPDLNRSLNLNPTAPSNSCPFVSIRGCHSKLNKTERFRTKIPGAYYTNKRSCCSAGFQPAVSQTSSLQAPCPFPLRRPIIAPKSKWEKMRHFRKHTKPARCAAATYNDRPSSCLIFKELDSSGTKPNGIPALCFPVTRRRIQYRVGVPRSRGSIARDFSGQSKPIALCTNSIGIRARSSDSNWL